MHVLVTGGAGFIGANFVRHVLQTQPDVRVTNLDALTYAGNLASLVDVADDPRYRFVHGDVCDAGLVDELVTGVGSGSGHGRVDAVVHFAAESHVDRSIDGPAEFLRTNVSGAGVVFEACRRAEVDRVLHISTDEVYGSVDEPDRFVEGDALEPNSPYSASKAAADLLARSYGVTYGYPITVTRTANNFGPFHFPEKMIPLFVTNLIDGLKVPLYGDGRNVRDWTYVADNVAAQWLVLTEGVPGEVYNVGAGNELTNRELTFRLLERLGADEDMIEHVPDRPGHDLRYAVDTTKVRALGWSPAHSLDEALDGTVAWYRTNEDWWRPLKAGGASARRGTAPSAKG
ncbi:dTDP-glucose 4,6-dehydratase [Nitriliruptor alkaliphilus]|uniref:dTDP-glucose 4,6-dehydratase n=1 Tax=Nitriliruptor alkaliphilus TaxID=427918 RepID=UPI00069881BA|nr:dTDP-glucose 4,6-dehydratase [Nitriliruptor alkaliphilus]